MIFVSFKRIICNHLVFMNQQTQYSVLMYINIFSVTKTKCLTNNLTTVAVS